MKLKAFICVLLFSCSSSEVPSGIVPPDEMKTLMFDMIRTDEYINNFRANDTTVDLVKERSRLYEKVFVLHDVTKEKFYKSYKYYQQNPDKHKQLFDSLMSYGKQVRDKPVRSIPADTLNTK